MKHTIVSDLPTFERFDEWAEERLSAEEFKTFQENKASVLPSAQAKVHVVYMEWVKDQKITHTIIEDDGSTHITSYNDFE